MTDSTVIVECLNRLKLCLLHFSTLGSSKYYSCSKSIFPNAHKIILDIFTSESQGLKFRTWRFLEMSRLWELCLAVPSMNEMRGINPSSSVYSSCLPQLNPLSFRTSHSKLHTPTWASEKKSFNKLVYLLGKVGI